MSTVQDIKQSNFGQKASSFVQKHGSWMKNSFSPVGKIIGGGFGIYMESMTTGREYGYGAGIALGALYSIPLIGISQVAIESGIGLGNYLYKNQQSKRTSSFSQGFQDPFGNAATMRQRSGYNLRRDRSALGREALMFHR